MFRLLPPRLIVSSTGPPTRCAPIMVAALCRQVTGLPSTAVMTSPRRRWPTAGSPLIVCATVSVVVNAMPSWHSAGAADIGHRDHVEMTRRVVRAMTGDLDDLLAVERAERVVRRAGNQRHVRHRQREDGDKAGEDSDARDQQGSRTT